MRKDGTQPRDQVWGKNTAGGFGVEKGKREKKGRGITWFWKKERGGRGGEGGGVSRRFQSGDSRFLLRGGNTSKSPAGEKQTAKKGPLCPLRGKSRGRCQKVQTSRGQRSKKGLEIDKR